MSNNHIAVQKLVEYLRIKTVHPEPDYPSALKFLKQYAEEIGFDSYKEIEVIVKKRLLIIKTLLIISFIGCT